MSAHRHSDHGARDTPGAFDVFDSFSAFDLSVRVPEHGALRCPHCGSLRKATEYQFPHDPTCIMLTLLAKRLTDKEMTHDRPEPIH